MMVNLIYIACLNIIVFHFTISFNIDTTTNNVWQFSIRPSDTTSHFGASVVLVSTNGVQSLLVGAPKFNNSNTGGALFKCDANNQSRCVEIPTTGIDNETNGQLSGFSISKGYNSTISCSPLWHRKEGAWQQFRGRCNILDGDLQEVASSSPCAGLGVNQGDYGFCSLGLDTTSSKEEELFIVGAPGALHFKGSISGIYPESLSSYGNFETDRVLTENFVDRNAHFGYSVAWGRFTNTSQRGDVAVGVPRLNDLQGSVYILSIEDNNKFGFRLEVKSDNVQTGAYFGSSVCTVDLDGDGDDDLLVGSPFYSTVQNEGRVYVFMNDKFTGFDSKPPLVGDEIPGGQFGLTIVNLGDVTNDGFPDVAIGAPFGGRDGNGAVYIYNGYSGGIRSTFSQVIYGSDIQNSGTGFGLSITLGVDVDNNGYPDVAVGSYLVGKVHLFRSKAVATLRDNLITNVTQVPPEEETAYCTGPDMKRYHCIELSVNLRDSAPRGPAEFDVEVTLSLDVNKVLESSKRAFFINPITNTLTSILKENVTLKNQQTLPLTKVVYVKVSVELTDILSAIEISSSYRVYENALVCLTQLCPVLDVYGTTSGSASVSYQRLCQETECQTDLVIYNHAISMLGNFEEIVYGAVDEFEVLMEVINLGEPAYQAMMKLNYSTDFRVIGVQVDGNSFLWTSIDISSTVKEASFIIANPVERNEVLKVVVSFMVNSNRPSIPVYEFTMQTLSFGNDTNPSNNVAELKIGTKVLTCVNVNGQVDPPLVFYDVENAILPVSGKNISVNDIGPEVIQQFFISNNGRLAVNTLNVQIKIVKEKENLEVVYLVDILANGIRCNKDVNPLQLRIPVPDDKTTGPTNPVAVLNDNKVIKKRRRRRRDASNDGCQGVTCMTYNCPITRLENGKTTAVQIVSRLLSVNLGNLQNAISNMRTSVDVQFDGGSKDLNVQQSTCKMQHFVDIKVNARQKSTSDEVTWWWILLAVVGTLIVLALICAILYRIGFFKRNRQFEEIQDNENNGDARKNKYSVHEDDE